MTSFGLAWVARESNCHNRASRTSGEGYSAPKRHAHVYVGDEPGTVVFLVSLADIRLLTAE